MPHWLGPFAANLGVKDQIDVRFEKGINALYIVTAMASGRWNDIDGNNRTPEMRKLSQ